MPRIRIVDYGVGNIHSAMKGLKLFVDDVALTEDPSEIRAADALVLPGQGSFEAGMRGLRVRGLIGEVKAFAAAGKPILGICLGAQILLDRGFEFGDWEGLGIIPGTVVHFPPLQNAKTPHMGWSAIEPSGAEMYFIHSYILQPTDPAHVLATTVHGGVRFASVIGKGKVLGCQFHPEKSGKDGLEILRNFCEGL